MSDVPPGPPPGAPPPPGSPAPGSGPGNGPGYGPGYAPGYGPGYGYAGPPPHKPGVVALRPLGLGDLYDGAFKTMRRNPKAMVGLSALVITAFLLVPALGTAALAAGGGLTNVFDGLTSGNPSSFSSGFDAGLGTDAQYAGSLFAAIANVLLNGLLVHVVAEAVLGRRTSIGQAWSAARGRLLRLLGLALLNGLVGLVLIGGAVLVAFLVGSRAGLGAGLAVGIPLFLLAIAALLFVQVRYFLLAPPALVLEKIGVRASLRRGTQLSQGQFWRLLGITLLTGLIVGVAGQVVAVPLGLLGVGAAAAFHGAAGALAMVYASYLSQIIVGALTTPFTSAVVALQYVDQRIRKEGLDVQLIAASQESAGRQPGAR